MKSAGMAYYGKGATELDEEDDDLLKSAPARMVGNKKKSKAKATPAPKPMAKSSFQGAKKKAASKPLAKAFFDSEAYSDLSDEEVDEEDDDDDDGNGLGQALLKQQQARAQKAQEMQQKVSKANSGPNSLAETMVFRRAYQQAVENGDPQPWGWSKLMIIGQGAAGKTSTVRSLLGLAPVKEWESTVGVDLKVTSADEWTERDHAETDFNLMLHKAAAQIVKEGDHPSKPAEKAASSSRGSSAVRTSRRVSKSVLGFLGFGSSAAKKQAAEAEAAAAAAAAAKADGEDDEDPAESELAKPASLLGEEEVARTINLEWARKLTNSEDTPLRFAIWDYGGQEVFYALHHVFLTKYGVYVLVFDMRQMLNDQENALSYVRFWLNSVKLHAESAPVVIVGTYADEVTSDSEYQRIEAILRREIGTKLMAQVVKDVSARRSFFPINNASNDPLRGAKLRGVIEDCASGQDYVKQKISLRWIKVLTELVEDTSNQYVSMPRVRSLGSSYGIVGEELNHMLRFFNEIGALVHLDANEALRKNIVTQPQWLLNKLSCVIADEMHVENMYYDNELHTLGLLEDFVRMRTTGIASYELLQYLWNGEEVDFLIEFMNSSMLLSAWKFGEERAYLVTSLLRDDSDTVAAEHDAAAQAIDRSEFEGGAVCALDFSEFYLPDGVFQRLVPICAEFSSRNADSATPRLSRHCAQVSFGWTDFLLEAETEQDRILISFKPDAEDVGECVKVIVSMFRELKDNVMQNLKWKLVLFAISRPAQGVVYEDLEGARKRKATKVRDTNGKPAMVADFNVFFKGEETVGSLVMDETHGGETSSTDLKDRTQDAAAAAADPKGFDVFISHKQSSGGDQVAVLYEQLKQRGLRVWFDEFMPEITKPSMEEGVKHSSTFLLFLSRDVFRSAYVKFELQTAISAGKPILLVHETDTQRLSYADFDEYIRTAPDFAKEIRLFEQVESIPFQRRYFLQKAFVEELAHRIEDACTR